MNRTLRYSLFLSAVLASGCGKGHQPAANQQNSPVAVVQVQKVESLKRASSEEVVGTVRPKLSASISAKISGTIREMLVAPGQTVKAGELLAEIDAREIQARLDQAAAVRDQAEKELARLENLLKQNAVTQQEYDNVQARVRVAQATVSEAQTMLGYTKITAPFGGIVTFKYADVGDLAAPSKPLLQLEDPATLRFEADLSDALIGKVKLGDKLPVRLAALNTNVDGTVAEIVPVADPVTRTFRVKLDLPAVEGMRSGQFGRVLVPVAEVNAIWLPESAVAIRGQMEIAFVVVNQHAQMRLVKTGKHLGNEVEILSGLAPGELVATNSVSQLIDGQPVEVK